MSGALMGRVDSVASRVPPGIHGRIKLYDGLDATGLWVLKKLRLSPDVIINSLLSPTAHDKSIAALPHNALPGRHHSNISTGQAGGLTSITDTVG